MPLNSSICCYFYSWKSCLVSLLLLIIVIVIAGCVGKQRSYSREEKSRRNVRIPWEGNRKILNPLILKHMKYRILIPWGIFIAEDYLPNNHNLIDSAMSTVLRLTTEMQCSSFLLLTQHSYANTIEQVNRWTDGNIIRDEIFGKLYATVADACTRNQYEFHKEFLYFPDLLCDYCLWFLIYTSARMSEFWYLRL